jgi:membrane protease YdiL (CAAX protease family)
LRRAIRERPVTFFLAFAFAISYLLGIPFNMAASTLFAPSSFWAIYAPRVVTVIGPALAALLVASLGGGTIPPAHLLRSVLIPVRYLAWIPAMVAAGSLLAIGSFVLAGLPAVKSCAVFAHGAALFAAHLAIQFLVVGLGEEVGWRGWLLPALAARRPFGLATAVTGLAWIAWHAPVFFSGIQLALAFVGLLIALSVIEAWLWLRTAHSVGIVAVAHAAVNAPFVLIESTVRSDAAGAAITMSAFGYLAALYAGIALALGIGARRIWTLSSVA